MYKILKAEKLADKNLLMNVAEPRDPNKCNPEQIEINKELHLYIHR